MRLTDFKRAATEAQELAAGHADAAHQGVFDADCDRCVGLAALCGVDLRRPSDRCEHPGLFADGNAPTTSGPDYLAAYAAWLAVTHRCDRCGADVPNVDL